jgi:hypothetical protein
MTFGRRGFLLGAAAAACCPMPATAKAVASGPATLPTFAELSYLYQPQIIVPYVGPGLAAWLPTGIHVIADPYCPRDRAFMILNEPSPFFGLDRTPKPCPCEQCGRERGFGYAMDRKVPMCVCRAECDTDYGGDVEYCSEHDEYDCEICKPEEIPTCTAEAAA